MKVRAYAARTTVPVEKTRAEIERLLTKHGAAQLGIVTDADRGLAMVLFTLAGRQVRLRVPLPRLDDVGPARRTSARDRQVERWHQRSEEHTSELQSR